MTAEARDALSIGAARRALHDDIARYSSARALALGLNRSDEARLLPATFDEEGADRRLASITGAFGGESTRSIHPPGSQSRPPGPARRPARINYDNRVIHLLALLGILGISFSAVFIRLAAVSPVTAVFYRAAYAVPVLLLVWAATRGGDRRSRRARLIAIASGLVLAVDLAFWHESIALIGAGLATVIANVQVVFVALAAWALYRQRPTARTSTIIAIVLGGLALTSGLARHDAYGSAPVRGVVFGVLAGACYAGFLLLFRASNRSLSPTSGPLLDSTIGTVVGALLVAPFDARFSLAPFLPAHLWLLLLALVSQVAGWLLIATALPRLPALETSVLLLVQPVFALLWGMLLFRERLSTLQWLGTGLVLAGVAAISVRGRATSVEILNAPRPRRAEWLSG